ncbi:MAG: zinc ribbon domain-containing protein [Steroidobacteraceae bacterium]
MSYEYNASNGRFEIANPYRLENIALFSCGAIATCTALYVLLGARAGIASAAPDALRGVVVGVLLLAAGLGFLGKAFSQLRYYFGRGRPHNLSNPDMPATRDDRARAAWLKENLRQNALQYAEPQGPISGLLHHLIPNLIFAPRLVRWAAEAQCFNALYTIALLLCILMGWMLYPEGSATDWIAVAVAIALAPALRRNFAAGNTNSSLLAHAPASKWTVILIAVIPILGPPLLARVATALPDISAFHIARTVGICFVILLVAQALFFSALLRQLPPQPAINMSCEQRAVSFNGHPGKVFEELLRLLQSRWTETIPNRDYLTVRPPDVFSGQSGSFTAEALQETQPVPAAIVDGGGSIADAATDPRIRSISALLLLATTAFIAGTIAAVTSRLGADHTLAAQFVSANILAVVLFLAALYAFRSAHLLLGRVDFDSTLLWVEFAGTYEEAEVNIGNQFSTALSTSKKVINVETMTMRVWVAELTSVILHKDGIRDLIGMRGRPDLASYYADHLTAFAQQMTAVVAPGSQADRARIGAIGQIQQESGLLPGGATGLLGTATTGATVSPRSLPPTAAAPPREPLKGGFCVSCGAALAPAARFCGECGVKA